MSKAIDTAVHFCDRCFAGEFESFVGAQTVWTIAKLELDVKRGVKIEPNNTRTASGLSAHIRLTHTRTPRRT